MQYFSILPVVCRCQLLNANGGREGELLTRFMLLAPLWLQPFMRKIYWSYRSSCCYSSVVRSQASARGQSNMAAKVDVMIFVSLF